MTSERLGEMFKGDSADMCGGKFLLVLMGEQVDPSSQSVEILVLTKLNKLYASIFSYMY